MKNEIIGKKRLNFIITICIMLSSAALGFCFLLMQPHASDGKDLSQAATGVTATFMDDVYGATDYTQDTGSFLLLETPASTTTATFKGWQAEGDTAGYYSGNLSDGKDIGPANADIKMSPIFMENLTGFSELAFSINIWITVEYYQGGDMVIFSTSDNQMGLVFAGFNMELIFYIGNLEIATSYYAPDMDDGNWHMLTISYATGIIYSSFSMYQILVDGRMISEGSGSSEKLYTNGDFHFYFGGEREGQPYGGEIANFGFYSTPIAPEVAPEIFANALGLTGMLFIFGENDVVFNAIWEAKPITLRIDANGGSYGGATTISKTAGETTTLSVPTKPGYKFKGWSNIGDEVNLLPGDNTFESYAIGDAAGFRKPLKAEKFGVSTDAKNGSKGFSLTGGPTNSYNPNIITKFAPIKTNENYTFSTWFKSKKPNLIAIKIYYSNSLGVSPEIEYMDANQWVYCSLNISNVTSDGQAQIGIYDEDMFGISIDDCGFFRYYGSVTDNTYTFGEKGDTLVATWEAATWVDHAQEPTLNADGYYHVSKPEQLAWFAKQSLTQNVTARIKLVNDIDLSLYKWIPIGSSLYRFLGLKFGDGTAVFDGQGHSITGLSNFYKKGNQQALFGWVQYATIKNVTVSGEISVARVKRPSTTSYTAGLVGFAYTSVIENCVNNVNVFGGNFVGGIVGEMTSEKNNYSAIINNCTNNGKIEGITIVAGIVGRAGAGGATPGPKITNCTNTGEIIGVSVNVGGISAECYTVITNCTNFGKISGSGEVGGIVGQSLVNFPEALLAIRYATQILNCTNSGEIHGSSAAGGIAGALRGPNAYNFDATATSISNCTNFGSVFASGGGVIGYFSGTKNTINNCVNMGKIEGHSIGGVIGSISPASGILVNKCKNFGNLSSTNMAGGIVGDIGITQYNPTITFSGCYSEGDVSGSVRAGGLIAINNAKIIIENCGVKGNITQSGSTTTQAFGGLVGESGASASATISIVNSFYIGTIFANSLSANAWIVGQAAEGKVSTINNTYCDAKYNIQGIVSDVKKYTAGDYAEFSYLQGVYNQMPVPSGLFWIGGVGGQNVVAYLQGKGFTLLA